MRDNERLVFVDIARGLLIILVVCGHVEVLATKYIYWFHMPAFFIISGMFLPGKEGTREMFTLDVLGKRLVRFFVPYASYFVLIAIVSWFFIHTNFDFTGLVLRYFMGGRLLVGVYGTLWFITSLFISQYLFFGIQLVSRNLYISILLLIIFYFLGAHIIRWLDPPLVPYNFDVSLVAVSYLFIGYLFKDQFMLRKRYMLLPGVIISALILMASFILWDVYVKPNYFELDMKYARFNNIILDMIIPVVFFIGIIFISFLLSGIKWLSAFFRLIGEKSLHIMYLHLTIIALLKTIGVHCISIQIAVAALCPILIIYLLERNKVLRFLFTGKYY